MMNIVNFLVKLRTQSIFIAQDNGQLSIMADRRALNKDIQQQLINNKQAILACFADLGIASNRQLAPLSFNQRSLWLLDQMAQGSVEYVQARSLKMTASADLSCLNKTFNHILARHEILRTNIIVDQQGHPWQLIAEHRDVCLDVVDLSGLSESEKESQFAQLSQSQKTTPFNLAQDIMFRGQVVILSADSYVFLYALHHIVADHWSLTILERELTQTFQAFVQDKPASTTSLDYQYADYADNQQRWLESREMQQQLVLLCNRLQDIPALHSLPLDYPRSPQHIAVGADHYTFIDSDTLNRVERFCHQQGVTLFMALQTIFAILLARFSNQKDIVMGIPVANRLDAEVESLVGFFANSLVLRSDLTGQPSFKTLLKRNKQMLLDSYACQQVPFEMVIEKLKPERSLSYSPLFQIMLILQNKDEGGNGDFAQKLSDGTTHDGARFDITLNITKSSEGLSLRWAYDANLFKSQTLVTMSGCFQRLLMAMLDDVHSQVLTVDMLSEQQKDELLYRLNPSRFAYPQQLCLHQLFEQQAARVPHQIALRCQQQVMSYDELNQRANGLARYLLEQRKMQVGQLVGICIERGFEMMVAVMGILKAGGAYVPLDPNYPKARIDYIIQSAGVEVVLTQKSLQQTDILNDCNTLALDDFYQLSTINPVNVALSSDDLAYIIFTSGSTGKPKGVAVTHHNVSALVHWSQSVYSKHQLSKVLASTSLNFDLSVFEMFVPLSFGHEVVIVDDALTLLECPLDITLINTVPSAIKVLLAQQAIPQSVNCINLCGEPLPKETLNGLLQSGDFVVNNLYGPSEDTVYSTYHCFTETVESIPTIGKIIANSQGIILSAEGQLVPKGVAGELYLGGDGVADGYFNQPELTEQRFIPNPFHDASNGQSTPRLYRTGDLVRYEPEGTLAFLGRIDDQVKVRGFRIELGEIESQIKQHHKVKATLVMAQPDMQGSQMLVAYIEFKPSVDDNEHQQLFAQLKVNLAANLTDYMMPNHFVVIEQWPLTPNGKINRKALQEIEISGQNQDEYIAPCTPEQQQLCRVWQKIFELQRVGITDNFFKLGGHSLLIMRLIFEMKKVGFAFTPRQVVENPTITSLLELDRDLSTSAKLMPQPNQQHDGIHAMPNRQWLYQGPHQHHWNIAGLCVIHQANTCLLEQALKQMFRAHQGLRHCFVLQSDGSVVEQLIPLEQMTLLQLEDLSGLSSVEEKDKQLEAIANQYQQQMRLDSRLHRFVLFDYGDGLPSRFLWIFQHALLDGYSHGLFRDELILRYLSLVADKPLPELPQSDSIVRWSQHLYQYANSKKSIEIEKDYWQSLHWSKVKLLADYPQAIADNRGDDVSLYGQDLWIQQRLDADSSALLKTQAWVDKTISTADVVNYAFAKALAVATQSQAVFFNLVCRGRDSLSANVDVSYTLGWFSDSTPTWLNLDNQLDVATQIQALKHQLNQIPQMGLGFNAIKSLCDDKSTRQWFSDLPQAEVLLNYVPPQLASLDHSPKANLPWQLIENTPQIYGNTEGQDHCAIAWPSYVLIDYQHQCFQIAWSGRDNIYKEKTITSATTLWVEFIKEAINALTAI